MLTIFNIKSKLKQEKEDIKLIISDGEYKGKIRHYPPANKEWKNSIYAFNKNTLKLLPVADNVILELIRGYFNMYNVYLRKKNKIRRLSAWKRRIYGRKFWIGKPELKHTNDKIIVNLFVYNRQKKHFLKKIKNLSESIKLKIFLKKMHVSIPTPTLTPKPKQFFKKIFTYPPFKRLNLNKKPIKYIKEPKYVSNVNSNSFIKRVTKLKLTSLKLKRWIKKNFLLTRNVLNSNNLHKGVSKMKFFISKYINNAYFNTLKKDYHFRIKIMRKELFLMHYMQSYFFNQFKFSSTYIQPLIYLLNKIYKKKIIFNIIKLKTYFLDSEVLTQILLAKTINRNNKITKIFIRSLLGIKVPYLNVKLIAREPTKLIGSQNILMEENEESINVKDPLNIILKKNFKISERSEILNSLKNKTVSGVRLEASGRLTKRITAARSVFKVRYIGTLKHIDSSYKGISSVMLRANIKSNTQFSKQNSKRRIGSFGLKGWISSV